MAPGAHCDRDCRARRSGLAVRRRGRAAHPHREYENITRTIEKLNALFAERDLVIVEGRDAGSDTHVLALPLAYIYGRDALVLFSPRPGQAAARGLPRGRVPPLRAGPVHRRWRHRPAVPPHRRGAGQRRPRPGQGIRGGAVEQLSSGRPPQRLRLHRLRLVSRSAAHRSVLARRRLRGRPARRPLPCQRADRRPLLPVDRRAVVHRRAWLDRRRADAGVRHA